MHAGWFIIVQCCGGVSIGVFLPNMCFAWFAPQCLGWETTYIGPDSCACIPHPALPWWKPRRLANTYRSSDLGITPWKWSHTLSHRFNIKWINYMRGNIKVSETTIYQQTLSSFAKIIYKAQMFINKTITTKLLCGLFEREKHYRYS